jgi:hypothetical protein
MNTHGVGSLWFDGRFFSQTLLHDITYKELTA